jgi:hypothetical protein
LSGWCVIPARQLFLKTLKIQSRDCGILLDLAFFRLFCVFHGQISSAQHKQITHFLVAVILDKKLSHRGKTGAGQNIVRTNEHRSSEPVSKTA